MSYSRPRIVLSKCIEFDACRYDGQMINNKYVKLMKNHIDFLTVCPEVEIGMGIPRDTIHLVDNKGKAMLIQSATNKDYAPNMIDFSNEYLSNLNDIDGFILKSRSPSCGISSTKIYPKPTKNTSPLGSGPGLFTSKAIEYFPNHPKEEDKRLNDIFLREHFLTSIFTIAEFRNVSSFRDLYNFQGKHKYLFMTYNQVKMRQMGKIAANFDEHPFEKVKANYLDLLYKLFLKRPRYLSNINTQMHIFGYFKNELSSEEKVYFLELLDKYREGIIPISGVNIVLKSWSLRIKNEYLINQSYFQPFPKELVILNESRMK